MPITIDDTVIMEDDGKFTTNFKPEMLGEAYKDSKFFETTPDLTSLMKAAVDTKAAVGKKLDNVIQKPSEGATDQQKVEYYKMLKKELGAPETIEAYDFPVPEGLTEDADFTKVVKEMFLAEGISPGEALRMVGKWNKFQLAQAQAAQQVADDSFTEESKIFKASHVGDKLIVGGRIAAKAILQFADEELQKLLKESKIIETPDDLDKWRNLGFSPSQLAIWENIGISMKSDTAITDEGNPANKGEGGDEPKEGTKEAVIKKTYDHETSVADRKARGKNY